jgi:hypothetical protein
MSSHTLGLLFCGFVCGAFATIVMRFIWSEFRREYEERVERRARVLASTKFAQFAGIK